MSKIKGYQKAGWLALVSLFSGIVALILPTPNIGYVVSPFFFLIASASLWIWRKGRHGTAKDRQWVEDNF